MKLTQREWDDVCGALSTAMGWQDTLATGYAKNSPEGKAALAKFQKYARLYKKIARELERTAKRSAK